jgi:hypothetical protein
MNACDELKRLREAMHNAPLNKVFTDHTGHKHLGTHSMAWARRSREWGDLKSKMENERKVTHEQHGSHQ